MVQAAILARSCSFSPGVLWRVQPKIDNNVGEAVLGDWPDLVAFDASEVCLGETTDTIELVFVSGSDNVLGSLRIQIM